MSGIVVPGTDTSLSMVMVPIIGSDQVIGTISIENYDKEYAFSEANVRLLQTVASSMGVALENARLFEETQQRNAELALINSIQQGLAAELNFQSIIDLVGDKLREIFNTGDIGIRWYESQANLIHYLYEYEHGVRLFVPSEPPSSQAFSRILETRQPVVMNTLSDQVKMAIEIVPGTDQSLSAVMIPIIGSDRVIGAIYLENYEREYAFTDANIRLMQTVASSMGVALEMPAFRRNTKIVKSD